MRLLHTFPLPPGSHRTATAPVAVLRGPAEQPGSPYLLDVPSWWSVPLPMDTVLAWLKAHPPTGLRAQGSGSGSEQQGRFAFLSYSADTSPGYNEATLLVEIAPNGEDASALRADGQTIWIPPRSPVETVPTDLARVQLVARRVRTTLMRRSLAGSAAATLAQAANALQRDNRGVIHCAMDTGFRISVTFVGGGSTLVYTELPACGSVVVTSNGNRQPDLLENAVFDRLVRADLGLPASAR